MAKKETSPELTEEFKQKCLEGRIIPEYIDPILRTRINEILNYLKEKQMRKLLFERRNGGCNL